MRGRQNKLIPIKEVDYANVEWMVKVMHAIAIAKSTKTRKFKVEGNKLFQIKTLLGMNPCLVVSFLAKCDPIAGTSDYIILLRLGSVSARLKQMLFWRTRSLLPSKEQIHLNRHLGSQDI